MDRLTLTRASWPGYRSIYGFTLVELMVAMACFALIASAIYISFGSQLWMGGKEEKILDVQRNARVAMDRLTWLFLHAGFGCMESVNEGGSMSGTFEAESIKLTSVVTIDNKDSNGTTPVPDGVTVILGFKKVAEVDGNYSKETKIKFKNIDTPTIDETSDFKKYVAFDPYTRNTFFTVKNVSDKEYTLDRAVDNVRDGTNVFMVSPVRVRVDENMDLLLQNMAYSNSVNWKVAEGIEDLQLQYTSDGGKTWVNSLSSPSDIEGVRIFLLARSKEKDMKHKDSRTYNFAGRTVGPFNDNYHRLLTRTTVWLRN